MKFLLFSDVHIGEYPEGRPKEYSQTHYRLNSRLIDTLHVWSWVCQVAQDRAVDAVIFGGDRFKPKRPPSWMRDLADTHIRSFIDCKVPLIIVVGNHDQWDTTLHHHTYGSVNIWKNVDDPVWVFSEPGIMDFNGFILALLPYGYPSQHITHELDPHGNNALIFHDAVSRMSQYNAHIVSGDTLVQRSDIDIPLFKFVAGGHIHLRQKLAFQNTHAFHIGTPLERIEDDDDQKKGVIIIDTDHVESMEFIESPFPKVYRYVIPHTFSEDDILTHLCVPQHHNAVLQAKIVQRHITPAFRRELVRQLSEYGVAAWDIRFMKYDTTEANNAIQIPETTRDIHEEFLEWVKQQKTVTPSIQEKIHTVLEESNL